MTVGVTVVAPFPGPRARTSLKQDNGDDASDAGTEPSRAFTLGPH